MKNTFKQFQAGFTLVEAVAVIVITGIIGAVVAVFIRAPVEGYFDSVARAELSDAADTALRRMTRDLRLALPNSIRTGTNGTDQYVEFLMTSTGGRYLDEDDDPAPGDNILDFNPSANLSFDVIGPPPVIASGNQIVVYNLGPGMDPANAYQGGNRAGVTGVAGNTVTLASNPFALQSPSMRSPGRRFQVVTGPVTYACENNTIVRYWGYDILPGQPLPPTVGAGLDSALLATGVTGCAFSYANLANIRSGLVGISITLQRNNESITLFQQVHVDNTP